VWVNAGLLGSGTHRVVGDRSRIVPHWMGRLEECTCLLCANGVIGVVDDWACAGGWVAGGGVQRAGCALWHVVGREETVQWLVQWRLRAHTHCQPVLYRGR